MKKKLLSVLLVLALLVQIVPITSLAYPTPELGAQDGTSKFASGVPLGVAHRAAWRDGPENSLIAIAASIRIGIDVAELDVKLTKDGVVVLSHDGSINRCVAGHTGNISGYTWEQLKQMPLEPNQGGSDKAYTLTQADAELLNGLPHYAEHSGAAAAGGTMPLTRLDDAIDLIKLLGPNTMINLDHCFNQDLFVACYVLFRETGMLNNVFFKNSVSASDMNGWYEAAAQAWNAKHPDQTLTVSEVQKSILYVYIIRSADYSVLQSHLDNGDRLVMVEICIADDAADKQIHEKLEPWCKEKGVAMFVNTMWSGLCSTKADTQTTWAEMLDRGYVAIQTDRPSELAAYLHDYNRVRASSEIIQAENFNGFNYESYGLSVAAGCDADMNKKVTGMIGGDWMSYRMSFTGDEAILNLVLQGMDDSTEVNVYLDDLTVENQIATARPGVASDYQTVSAEITGAITPGEHTLYIQALGLPNTKLVSMDSFRFVSGAGFEGEISVTPVRVTTEPGTAPQMPGTVAVTVNGSAYGLGVRWERILPESYAREGSFTVLGYISALKTYTTATVTVSAVVPEIPQEHLALWMDASEGVTVENGKVTAWASKVGDITAALRSGSPTLTANASGNQAGIRFDGGASMALTLPDEFWTSENAKYTVLMYVSADETTSGNGTGVTGPSTNGSQRYSVMWFPEVASWGGVYFTASQNEVLWRFGSGSDGDRGTTVVRPGSVGNAYNASAIRKDGSSDTVFVDGTQIYSGSAVSAGTMHTGSVGYIGEGQNGKFVGTVCQILIYDTALTDEQIIAAQRWMAEKYADDVTSVELVKVSCEAGKAPKLPSSVKVTYASGRESTMGAGWESVDPRAYLNAGTFTVSGTLANGMAITATVTVTERQEETFPNDNVLLWFSSQDGVTADGSGKVSAWKDKKTGSTVTATQTNANNQPTVVLDTDGKVDGIRFDGGDKMNFQAGRDTFNGYEGMTMVIYSKPEQTAPTKIGDNHNSSVIYFGETGSWGGLYMGAYTNGAGGRFATGTSNYRGVLYTGGSYTDYMTTVLRKNGGSADELIINGSIITDVKIDSGKAGPQTKNIDGNAGILGQGKNSTYWKGTVSEILIFDKALSDGELKLIYDWLDETYGEKQEVSQDGLLFWLDASEGVTADGSGKIQEWKSKVGNATAVYKKGDTALIPDALNGKPGVEFDGTEDVLQMNLASGAFNNLTGGTVIAYAASKTALNTSNLNYNGQRNTLFSVDEAGDWGSVFMGVYTNAVSARFGTGVSGDYGFVATRPEAVTDYSATVVRWNGATKSYDVDVDGADFATGSSNGSSTDHNKNIVYLGTGKENTYWTGTLCELLFYDRVLTDSEVAAVYDYLDAKYAAAEPETVPVTGVWLKEAGQQLDLYPGDTKALTASTIPANADNTALAWVSSNPAVASVDENGVVTAGKPGYAVITVTTQDGNFESSCTVRVQESEELTIWTDIQNLVRWAGTQDPAHYDNWDVMAAALEAVQDVTEDSSLEALLAAYQTLRDAMLALEPHVHALTKVEKKDPTCTEPGNSEYYVCNCGRWYLDAAAAQEITDRESVILPARGHSLGDWTHDGEHHWKACDCGEEFEKASHADGNADGKCDVCGYVMPTPPTDEPTPPTDEPTPPTDEPTPPTDEPTPPTGDNPPTTGDRGGIAQMALILLLSAAAIVTLLGADKWKKYFVK